MYNQRKFFPGQILILSLICIVSICKEVVAQGSSIDLNMDGSYDSFNQPVDQNTVFSAFNTCLKIGVLETQNQQYTVERLNLIGYSNIELLPVNAGGSDFENFDIIYLSTGWADAYNGSYDEIESKSEDYLEYIADGGNLFVEQPNPFGQSGSTCEPTILPYPITFYNFYMPSDYPPVALNPNHEITIGLDESEMAFPGDLMTAVDAEYEILVIGATTSEPSLVVTEYGKGKVLVCTANSNVNSIFPMSDLFMSRMLDWLGKRVYCTASIMGCGSYTWIDGITYTESNNEASYVLTDVLGCDSIVALDLTIVENNIDATVSLAGNTLTASTSGVGYQWLDCENDNAAIADANGQSYTPTTNGIYAVEIIDGICTDTSECISVMTTSVNDLWQESVEVYPNPTSQEITLDYGTFEIQSIKVYSVLGHLVSVQENISQSLIQVKINQAAGIYFIEILSDQGINVHRVVKE